MSEVTEPNGTVSYTVKELLARQDGKLDSILIALSGKAEKAEVERLAARVEIVERTQASSVGSVSAMWKAAPILLGIGTLALALIMWLRP